MSVLDEILKDAGGTSILGRAQTKTASLELTEAFERYSQKHTFKPGDLVQWKDGLKNKKWPEYGTAAIVVELVEPFENEDAEPGTPYWHEKVDMRIMLKDICGDFEIFFHDGSRFEPYKG